MTVQRITFADLGQDFLWWEIDMQTGRIVGCGPMQAGIWANGRVSVDLRTIGMGRRPRFFSPRQIGAGAVLRYEIVRIEPAPTEASGGGVFP